MTTNATIEKLIQRQIHQWHRYRQFLQDHQAAGPAARRPIITISRERGCGGRELAESLAGCLGLEVHGVSLIDHIARNEELEREIVAALDEQARSQVELWVKGVLGRRIYLRDNYHVSLVKAVRTLAAHGGVVFVGRGANLILEDRCDLRVLLVASTKTRIRNLQRTEDIDEKTARGRTLQANLDRQEFIMTMFHVEANDPRNYDLVVNVDELPVAGA
ncbi:MAG: cytidylate kinase-like family protein, partial [bacterium]